MNKAKIRNTIQVIYKYHPEVVNDEKALIAAVWRAYGWSDYRSLENNLDRMPHPESISRRRRELYNEGLIQYSSEALEARTDAFRNELDQHSGFMSKLLKRKGL